MRNFTLALPIPGPDPPSEFRIWPMGEIDTAKGRFLFDEEAARSVMAAYHQQGNELSVDYEHQTTEPVTNGPVPAAGWFDLQLRDDGLWATNVRWTPRALELLKSREYRYFSPYFGVDEDNRIRELYNLALTNLPATRNMRPLAAKAVPYAAGKVVNGSWDGDAAEGRVRRWAGGPDKGDVDWGKYEKAFAWYDAQNAENFVGYKLPHHDVQSGELVVSRRGVEAAAAAVQGSHGGVDIPEGDMAGVRSHLEKHYHEWGGKAPWERSNMNRLLVALGLAENASEDSALLAVTRRDAQRQALLSLTGKEDYDEALGTVRAWKDSAAQTAALSTRVAELETNAKAAEVASLLEQGKKDGKLSPALLKAITEQDEFKGMRENPAMLKAYLAAAPKLTAAESDRPAPGEGPAHLSAEELRVCQLTGTDPKVFAKYKAEKEMVVN